MAKTIITSDGDMLDLIAFREYGYSSGAVEAILNANYGLADRPPVLPAGIIIILPDIAPAPAKQPVRLWD
jgi:phage tail protein X